MAGELVLRSGTENIMIVLMRRTSSTCGLVDIKGTTRRAKGITVARNC